MKKHCVRPDVRIPWVTNSSSAARTSDVWCSNRALPACPLQRDAATHFGRSPRCVRAVSGATVPPPTAKASLPPHTSASPAAQRPLAHGQQGWPAGTASSSNSCRAEAPEAGQVPEFCRYRSRQRLTNRLSFVRLVSCPSSGGIPSDNWLYDRSSSRTRSSCPVPPGSVPTNDCRRSPNAAGRSVLRVQEECVRRRGALESPAPGRVAACRQAQ